MKKRSSKKARKVMPKKVDKYDSWDKIAMAAATLMILVALALLYNIDTVGEAIVAPAPPVDLSLQESESLDLSSYNQMGIKLKLSSGSELSEFALLAENNDGLVQYQLVQEGNENVFAYGLLNLDLESSGNLYLDDDNVGDMELTLQGDLLTVTNLNYVEPDIAEFEVYDGEFNKISDDILDVELNQETSFYLNVTSTSSPEVSATIDGSVVEAEEVDAGSDFKMVKITFTGSEEKPYQFVVTADVGGEETHRDYILAVNGYVYELVENGYTARLHKDSGGYETLYELEKTSELQPVSLLCGELDLGEENLTGSIEKILSYKDETEQWKENVPSEFGTLSSGRGYLLDLNDGASLTFRTECDGRPLPETPILGLGWNLVGTNGYKGTEVADLESSEGEFTAIYEYGNPEVLSSDELISGMIYWIKVE